MKDRASTMPMPTAANDLAGSTRLVKTTSHEIYIARDAMIKTHIPLILPPFSPLNIITNNNIH